MARVIPLFSSSKGNSFYVQGNDEAILIDAGRSCRQIENELKRRGGDISKIKAVLITHEHTDHISALYILTKKYHLPVYASQGTLDVLSEYGKVFEDTELLVADEDISVGGFIISPIETSHDARESCGYKIITPDKRKLSIVTDTGFLLQDARDKGCGCDVLIIESNHDIKMLDEGTYPYILKKRIRSMYGHLSNDDCAKELPMFVNSGVKRILLAHLSQENNTPAKALGCAIASLEEAGYTKDIDYTIDALLPENNEKSISF